jgi:dTDP-4-dehydrorhamnose 3,5-epimerase
MVPSITTDSAIDGIQLVRLSAAADSRGRFTEIFRKEWFPQRSWDNIQMNRSESQAGVLRGLHYHFNQVDYWYLLAGAIRVGLVDLRPSSPTFRASFSWMLRAEDNAGIYIPVGVAHGFYALTDVTLLYVVDNYYDGADEFGLAWNDPELGPDWEIAAQPTLSARDAANPFWSAIPAENRPAP